MRILTVILIVLVVSALALPGCTQGTWFPDSRRSKRRVEYWDQSPAPTTTFGRNLARRDQYREVRYRGINGKTLYDDQHVRRGKR